jgi:hypothetical protein
MSTFLSTSIIPQIDLYILRRDFFDGFSLLLQDGDGSPFDLSKVQVCASVWKKNSDGSTSQISTLNIEEQEPLNAGRVRLWLSSSQTAAIWDAYGGTTSVGGTFFPSAYAAGESSFASSPLIWDVRTEKEEELADLVSVSGGTFISQINHGLGATERVIFRSTAQSSINYDDTSARIYSNLTSITYAPPYSFTIASLSGVTDAAIGGSVYRLKQDTVVAGSVVVGTTLSNCFP